MVLVFHKLGNLGEVLALRPKVLVQSLAKVLTIPPIVYNKHFSACKLSLNDKNHLYFGSSSVFKCLVFFKRTYGL